MASSTMRTRLKNQFLWSALIAGLGLIAAGRVTAQTFTNLHSFTGGSDGASPEAGLILSGKNTVTNPVAAAQKFYRLSQ
jgi:hypothetical protein